MTRNGGDLIPIHHVTGLMCTSSDYDNGVTKNTIGGFDKMHKLFHVCISKFSNHCFILLHNNILYEYLYRYTTVDNIFYGYGVYD